MVIKSLTFRIIHSSHVNDEIASLIDAVVSHNLFRGRITHIKEFWVSSSDKLILISENRVKLE